MKMQQRKRSLDELRETARAATRSALENYERVPDDARNLLTLGTRFDGDDRIFELYIPGELPQDAVILTRVRVNAITGEVGPVEVFLPRRVASSEP